MKLWTSLQTASICSHFQVTGPKQQQNLPSIQPLRQKLILHFPIPSTVGFWFLFFPVAFPWRTDLSSIAGFTPEQTKNAICRFDERELHLFAALKTLTNIRIVQSNEVRLRQLI